MKVLENNLFRSKVICVLCGTAILFFPDFTFAGVQNNHSPLKLYIPNVESLSQGFLDYFTSGGIDYDAESSVVTARGNVEIEQGDTIIRAESLEYDQNGDAVIARGEVVILAPDGSVSFSDKTNLTGAVKEAVIYNFNARFSDNKLFMKKEQEKIAASSQDNKSEHRGEKPFVASPENFASAGKTEEKKSFFGKVFSFLAPDSRALGEKEAARLASLAPAAGGNEDAKSPAVPIIGSVPLINLKELEPKEDKINNESGTNDKDPAQIPVENTEEKKPDTNVNNTESIKKEEIKAEGKEPESEKNNTEKVNTEGLGKEKTIPKGDDSKADDVVADEKDTDLKNTKVKEVERSEDNKEKPAAPFNESDFQIPAGMSKKSKNIINKVTSSVLSTEESKKSSSPVAIDRTHEIQDLSANGEESSNASPAPPALGIKMDVGSRKFNIDYELEKAYQEINVGNSGAAMATYRQILDNAPNNTQALFGLATLNHRARQFDKARSLYARLLAVDPQHRDGFNNFLVLLADEAPDEAAAELERLEDKNPGFSVIPAQLAVIYQKLGKNDKALDKMFRAVSLAPENMTYRYNLAVMLDKQQKYAEAARVYRQLIEAASRGEKIPGNIENIQQRLTFISSNR